MPSKAADKTMRIGERGEELAGLLFRLGGLTARQYAAFAAPADEELSELGRRAARARRERATARRRGEGTS
ncbi:MAG: hypothetical protein M3P49_13470 [Actinomycetota bacterium]|nr:hypothetical protein [Actinomycetota bacterium]